MDGEKSENIMERTLNSFSNAVSEQDQKLWIQQATAKYYKIEYELLQKEDAHLDKKIDEEKEKLKKMEEKIPEIKKTKEDLMCVITISSNVVKHLIERRNDVREDVTNWKNKISEKEKEMVKFLNDERSKREEKNELYKQVQAKENALKLMKIKHSVLFKKSEAQKQQIKLRLGINQKLFHSKIVTFVRAITNCNRAVEICKEIETTKAALQELSLKLNKPAQRKPLTFQTTVSREFFHQPISSPWKTEKFSHPKMITSNVQENIDLLQLQQRSNERKKQYLQMLDGSLSIAESPQARKINAAGDKHVKKSPVSTTVATSYVKENADIKTPQQRSKERKRQYIEGPTNSSQAKKIVVSEDTQVKKAVVSATPNKPNKKIKLLQNTVIPETMGESGFPALKKPEPVTVKKVSFGQPLSEEKEILVWNNDEEEQNQSFAIPAGYDKDSIVFQKADHGIFNESVASKDNIGYSFLSPTYDVMDTTLDNLNESTNQMRDDFFVTPQGSGNGAPSIFSNFGFGDNNQGSSATLDNLNESTNQMRDDFFVTPQGSGNGAPSIFSNFGFGDNNQGSSGNRFFS